MIVADRYYKKVATAKKLSATKGMGVPTVAANEIAAHIGANVSMDGNLGMYSSINNIGRYLKSNRKALQDAASVSGLMVTTEAGVAETPKKDAGGAPAMPDMGGMGGMGGMM